MKKISCIIVDDDLTAIALLEKYIERLDNFEILSTFSNPIEAITFLQTKEVDLILLDVEMPKLSGIDFIKILAKKRNIILTTASRNYAFEGFELDVIDYVLKPFNFDRFTKAIDKFKELNRLTPLKQEAHYTPINKQGDAIFVKENYKTRKIYVNDIIYIESEKEYIKIVTVNGIIRTKQSLNYYDNQENNFPFLRIHRSFVINIEKVNSFTNTELQVGSYSLPVGRSYRDVVKEVLK